MVGGGALDSCFREPADLCIVEARLRVVSSPGCFVSNFDRILLGPVQILAVAVNRWSLFLEAAAAVVMTAPSSREGKHLSRSGLGRMDPPGDFAAVAMAAQMTVETRVYYYSDNTAEVSHGLLGPAMGGWMWRWRRKATVDRLEADGVVVMGDDTNAAGGEPYFPTR